MAPKGPICTTLGPGVIIRCHFKPVGNPRDFPWSIPRCVSIIQVCRVFFVNLLCKLNPFITLYYVFPFYWCMIITELIGFDYYYIVFASNLRPRVNSHIRVLTRSQLTHPWVDPESTHTSVQTDFTDWTHNTDIQSTSLYFFYKGLLQTFKVLWSPFTACLLLSTSAQKQGSIFSL